MPEGRVRHTVKEKARLLTAVPVVTEQIVSLPNGFDVRSWPGDWLILKDQQILNVVPPAVFASQYERADDTSLRVDGDARSRIERTLGIGSTETQDHLATAIERTARLVIGDVRVDFTPGQWEQLSHRAGKMGISVDALVQRIVEKITSDIWTV